MTATAIAATRLIDFRAPYDLPLFHLLNGLAFPPFNLMARVLSSHGFGWLFALGSALAVLAFRGRRALRPLLAGIAAVAATDVLGARVLKPLFHRIRPCYALPTHSLHQLFPVANQGSMPSLHAANAFALAYVLGAAAPRAAPFGYAVATLIALSRVVGGVHWPSDILAGVLFGLAMGALATWALRVKAATKASS